MWSWCDNPGETRKQLCMYTSRGGSSVRFPVFICCSSFLFPSFSLPGAGADRQGFPRHQVDQGHDAILLLHRSHLMLDSTGKQMCFRIYLRIGWRRLVLFCSASAGTSVVDSGSVCLLTSDPL